MSLRAPFAKQSPRKGREIFSTKSMFHSGSLPARGTLRRRRVPSTALDTPNVRADALRSGCSLRNDLLLFLLSSLLLFSCSTPTISVTPQLIAVYSTSAAQPWLPELYECAGTASAISRVDDPSAADIVLRVGEPPFLDTPAFQVDTEEILIVTHRQSPVQNLTVEHARALFAGQGDPSVQVWVYASGEDVQEVFDQVVMAGRSVSASASLAVNPQQMSDTLVNEANTVGILPRHWKAGDVREVFSVATVPVLAITASEPQGMIQKLLACLQ
jgi:hypothetical protein